MQKKNNPYNLVTHPYCYSGHEYALGVVAGEIPNCKYIVGACKRYLSDLEEGKYPFYADKAERYLRLVQKFSHVKGKDWKTANIVYEPWQNFVFMNVMGFYNTKTGNRRFRTAHIEIPRGNAKSAMASQTSLFFLSLDDPKGNEISCVATKTEQARIVLDSARAMAKANQKFLKQTGTEVLAHKVVHDKSNSFIRALSSDDKSLDGLQDVLAICDELHAMSRDLFEVISSGMSKRTDSLLLCITTAGFSTDGIGYDQSAYAKKVAMREVEDDQFFSAVYTIDDGDDIYDPITWAKANPNFGVSVDPVTFEAKVNKAKVTPSDMPNLLVKHFNKWISEAHAYFDLEAWDKCADPTIKIEDFYGEPSYSAVDLASKVDLAAEAHVFKKGGKYYVFEKSYIPEKTLEKVNSTLYDSCVAQKHLHAIPGHSIDYEIVQESFKDTILKTKNLAAHYDQWQATQFAQNLAKENIEMVEFRMSVANLSEPTKTFDAYIREGKIVHNGSPLLRWCLGNVIVKIDANDNVYPRKSHEKLKIDPVIAILMAFAGWLNQEQEESVYEERGIRFF